MATDRRYRAVAWLLHRLRLPAPIASRLLRWGLGAQTAVPHTVEQLVAEEAAEAERSATG